LRVTDNYLLSGGTDRELKVWDLTTHKVIHALPGHKDCIWSIVANNNMVYTSSDDRTIKIWDLTSFKCVKTLEYEQSKILALAISDNYLCMGTRGCKVGLWDLNKMELVKELDGHVWEVWQVCAKNGYVLSGSFDHTIKIWDLDTFWCSKTLEGHKGYVHALEVADRYLVSGSGDKTIKVRHKQGIARLQTSHSFRRCGRVRNGIVNKHDTLFRLFFFEFSQHFLQELESFCALEPLLRPFHDAPHLQLCRVQSLRSVGVLCDVGAAESYRCVSNDHEVVLVCLPVF